MDINKSHWDVSGDTISLSMSFAKVDKENRTVSGFATLDNADRQDDILKADASRAAFEQFRGNVREMHQNNAVGRMLSFQEQRYFDQQTNKEYDGIFVKAYISKGAPQTWEKVIDGTLTGFSIGGKILESSPIFDKALDKTIRVVDKYELVELSLVDSPANQLANIFSIEKADDGLVLKGMVAETSTETVFWCDKDNIAMAKDAESANCAICSDPMTNIGWIETNDSNNLRDIVQKFLSETAEENQSEGGTQVENETDATPVVEKAVDTEASEVVEEATTEVVEKAADVTEAEVTEGPDFTKALEDLTTTISDKLTKALSDTEAKIETVTEAITSFTKDLEAKYDELLKAHGELKAELDEVKSSVDSTVSKVDVIDAATATKKSGDLGGSTEVITKSEKSIWNGSFLAADRLSN
jgi:flagellar motility protein MotE (MotC chaperone)